jgi:hypothetical protein
LDFFVLKKFLWVFFGVPPPPPATHAIIPLTGFYMGVKVNVPAEICLGGTPRATIGLIPTASVDVYAQATAYLVFIRGGVRLDATILAISLGPKAQFTFTDGKLGACFQLPLTITALNIRFKWFYAFWPCIEWDEWYVHASLFSLTCLLL